MADLVIFIHSLRGGGLEKSILRLAVELNKQSVELDFVVTNSIDSAYRVPDELNFKDLNASRMRYSLFPLLRYLKKTKPRVLFSAGTALNIIAILAKIITGYPKRLVIGERNHLSSKVRHSSQFRDKFLPYFVRFLYPFADLVLAVSKSVADDVIAVGDLNKSKVLVVHNLFNIDHIITQASLPTGIDWIDEPEVPVLISVGRMVQQKAHDTLLKAFSVVKRQKKCRLIILGDGGKRVALQKLAEELQITNDVYMPGFVQNPYAYLSKAKLFVHSSNWEGLPAVLIEALACGIPVVSTNSPGGASEILENGIYGTLVPPQNPIALAEAILVQLDKTTEPERLIERARFFSSDCVLQKYMDVFGFGQTARK
ncbi:MAG: glycosyltransferase [Calditrichales bacterium]|nr:glycosyltransferase [Calditrichales bacterium]